MDATSELDCDTLSDSEVVAEDSLVEVNLNDSSELWLIQLPEDNIPDFDGQELSLELHQDGQLGSVEDSSGKVYSLLSYSFQESDATVFTSSPSTTRIAGKISRRVSLVRYPEPNEIKQLELDSKKQIPQSSRTSLTNSSHHPSASTMTHSRAQRNRNSPSKSQSTRSSKSALIDRGSESKARKRTAGEPSRYSDQSVQDSGITISGSSEKSQRRKSKVED